MSYTCIIYMYIDITDHFQFFLICGTVSIIIIYIYYLNIDFELKVKNVLDNKTCF
jgi:hypothetical protein